MRSVDKELSEVFCLLFPVVEENKEVIIKSFLEGKELPENIKKDLKVQLTTLCVAFAKIGNWTSSSNYSQKDMLVEMAKFLINCGVHAFPFVFGVDANNGLLATFPKVFELKLNHLFMKLTYFLER